MSYYGKCLEVMNHRKIPYISIICHGGDKIRNRLQYLDVDNLSS